MENLHHLQLRAQHLDSRTSMTTMMFPWAHPSPASILGLDDRMCLRQDLSNSQHSRTYILDLANPMGIRWALPKRSVGIRHRPIRCRRLGRRSPCNKQMQRTMQNNSMKKTPCTVFIVLFCMVFLHFFLHGVLCMFNFA